MTTQTQNRSQNQQNPRNSNEHTNRSQGAQQAARTVERERPGFHSDIGRKGGEHSHGGGKRNQSEE